MKKNWPLNLPDTWSQTSSKVNEADQRKTWESLKRETEGEEKDEKGIRKSSPPARCSEDWPRNTAGNSPQNKRRTDASRWRCLAARFGRHDSAEKLFDHLARTERVFLHTGQVFGLSNPEREPILIPVKAAGMITLARIFTNRDTDAEEEFTTTCWTRRRPALSLKRRRGFGYRQFRRLSTPRFSARRGMMWNWLNIDTAPR